MEHFFIFAFYLNAAGRGYAQTIGDNLRQGNQTLVWSGLLWTKAQRTVSQLRYAVGYAYGDRLAAYRANPLQCSTFLWRQANMAVAVSIIMILAFFGKKFYGAPKPLVLRLEKCFAQGRVGKLAGKNVCFPGQLSGGMRIGVGNQRIFIQCG